MFGDAKHPNPESALLVEEFTRHQMRDLVCVQYITDSVCVYRVCGWCGCVCVRVCDRGVCVWVCVCACV